MADDPIPDDVRWLVERHFSSVSELEALFVLIRENRPLTPGDVARALVVNDDHAEGLLAALAATPLIAFDGATYTFSPRKQRDRAAAELLAKLYDTYRLRIMNIVFSKPSEPLRDFADAFRIRPKKDDETEEGT